MIGDLSDERDGWVSGHHWGCNCPSCCNAEDGHREMITRDMSKDVPRRDDHMDYYWFDRTLTPTNKPKKKNKKK